MGVHRISIHVCAEARAWGEEGKKKKAQTERELCNQPKKYKKWSEELMMGTMKAVVNGLFGINR